MFDHSDQRKLLAASTSSACEEVCIEFLGFAQTFFLERYNLTETFILTVDILDEMIPRCFWPP